MKVIYKECVVIDDEGIIITHMDYSRSVAKAEAEEALDLTDNDQILNYVAEDVMNHVYN